MIRNSIQHICGSTDWSLLELSIFEQVKRSWKLQGVHAETECGMTDEGEPWLVFCDADTGEVLCHLARLGNKYVACVPFYGVGTTGAALTDVLDDFFKTLSRRIAPLTSQFTVSHGKI
jgi:hypothetical protein